MTGCRRNATIPIHKVKRVHLCLRGSVLVPTADTPPYTKSHIMRVSYLSLAHIMLTAASPHPRRDTSSVYWILAGDSTTAPGGGWGDGFLSTTVAPGSSGANYGHGGATTKSFREGGDWDRVLGDIESHKDTSRVYVTIQVHKFTQLPQYISCCSCLTNAVRPQRPET